MTGKTPKQSRWKQIGARRNPQRPAHHDEWEERMRALCPGVFADGAGEEVLSLLIERFVLFQRDLNASESALRNSAAIANLVLDLERYTREGPIDARSGSAIDTARKPAGRSSGRSGGASG